MDYSKIRLKNERCEHVTKRLNRLSTWKFFTVLYRENTWRLFGFSLLMLLCFAPMLVMLLLGSFNVTSAQQTLPLLNGFGFSTGAWMEVQDFLAKQTEIINTQTGLYVVATSLVCCLVLSGGLAVIRDAFWTGKLSTVGVFKGLWLGIKANVLYAGVSVSIISLSVFGLFQFLPWAKTVMPSWLAIVLLVILCIVALFVVLYCLILCSVSVTYEQSVAENLDDAWRLLWLNVAPNVTHLVFALLPVGLYFVFNGGLLQSFFYVLLMMFGGMYFPLVWQTHMMKTFALFHPVDTKKKKQQPKAKVAEAKPLAETEQNADALQG